MHADHRQRLPENRESVTTKITACGFTMYVTIGFYPDSAKPGEVFLRFEKRGSELSGLGDMVALLLSLSLQYGVPWAVLCEKMRGTRFGQQDVQYSSILDAIARRVDEIVACRASLIGEP